MRLRAMRQPGVIGITLILVERRLLLGVALATSDRGLWFVSDKEGTRRSPLIGLDLVRWSKATELSLTIWALQVALMLARPAVNRRPPVSIPVPLRVLWLFPAMVYAVAVFYFTR